MILDKKQKILLGLIIIAFIYMVWQVYDLFFSAGSPSSSAAVATRVEKTVASEVKAKPSTASPVTVASSSQQAPISQSTPPSVTNMSVSKEQTQYLKLLNQYQMLKMKHMLLEEEVAIAAARQKIAELSGGAGSFAGDAEIASFDIDQESGVIANDSGYGVVYIDKQKGRWNATINYNGKFYEVTPGFILADGSKVVDISKSQVILQKGTQFFRLTFSGMVTVTDEKK